MLAHFILTRENRLHPIEDETNGQKGAEVGDGVGDRFSTGEGVADDMPQPHYHRSLPHRHHERHQIHHHHGEGRRPGVPRPELIAHPNTTFYIAFLM